MKRVQIIRTHTSPYQGKDFAGKEKQALEALGITYTNPENLHPDFTTILITNTHTFLRELPQDLLANTSLILHPNSGYDNFMHDHELWKSIPIIIGHKIRAQAVAEYTLACLFEGLVELPQHLLWNRDRLWPRSLIQDQTISIFGYGHIGKVLAGTLSALGCKVQVIDPYITSCPYAFYKTYQEAPTARVVMVACGLNESSRKMFDKRFFARAPDNLLFINGARGKLVDESALREFLLSHPEAFAFLDVFESEPFGPEWSSFPQTWKSSHIAGVSGNLDQKIIDFEVEVLKDYLQGLDLKNKYANELLQNKYREGVLI